MVTGNLSTLGKGCLFAFFQKPFVAGQPPPVLGVITGTNWKSPPDVEPPARFRTILSLRVTGDVPAAGPTVLPLNGLLTKGPSVATIAPFTLELKVSAPVPDKSPPASSAPPET